MDMIIRKFIITVLLSFFVAQCGTQKSSQRVAGKSETKDANQNEDTSTTKSSPASPSPTGTTTQNTSPFPSTVPAFLAPPLDTNSLGCTNERYVDANGGKDSNSGIASAPWLTLQHAADVAKPGDLIHIRAGTYAGFGLNWDFNVSGTPGHYICFVGDLDSSGNRLAVINSRYNKVPSGINVEPGDGTSNLGYIAFANFKIRNDGSISRAGIRVTGNTNDIVWNNDIDGMGTWGIFTAFANNIIVKYNILSRSGSQHGLYISNTSTGADIERNESFGNAGCGMHFNGDASQSIPDGFPTNQAFGVSTHHYIAYNYIHDNSTSGGAGLNFDGVQDSLVENNILFNNHASGVAIFMIDAAAPSKNNTLRNNTIVMASNSRWAININAGSTGNILNNNILINQNPGKGSITITDDSLTGLKSDYNIVNSGSAAFQHNDDPSQQSNLASWQSVYKQDIHSIAVSDFSTLFIDFLKPDFHLAPSSQALGTGTGANLAPYDFDGNARETQTNVGAY